MKSVSIAIAIAIVFCAANIAAAGGGATASAEVAQATDLTGPIWTRLPAPSRGPKEPKEKYRRKKRQRKSWYWTATPPASGAQPIYIGPYPNLWDCRDMLGSALYAHPFECKQARARSFRCVNESAARRLAGSSRLPLMLC
jgi:hypothetical protein